MSLHRGSSGRLHLLMVLTLSLSLTMSLVGFFSRPTEQGPIEEGNKPMKARDVMVSPVITVKVSATVKDVARLLFHNRISAVPVLDGNDKLAGIVSEGDLLHREDIGTERRRPKWLAAFDEQHVLATDFIRSHATRVADIMTSPVITAAPDTPLHELATTMARHAIKHIPILRDTVLVGIVSRADLVQALASPGAKLEIPVSDNAIRDNLTTLLSHESWAHSSRVNVTVSNGVVNLWGKASSETVRTAIRVAAEATRGVLAVNDHIVVGPIGAI